MKTVHKMFIILTAFSLNACVSRVVYLPVPATFKITFDIAIKNGNSTFEESETLTAEEIRDEVYDQLEDLPIDDIRNYNIESVAFSVVQTNQPDNTFNETVEIDYANSGRVELFTAQDLELRDILNENLTPQFSKAGVTLLKTSFTEIIQDNSSSDIKGYTAGNVSQTGTTLVLELLITVTPVVEQEQEIFDPLGE